MYRRPLKLALYVGELHGMRILSLLISILKNLRDTSQVFDPGYTLQPQKEAKKKKIPIHGAPAAAHSIRISGKWHLGWAFVKPELTASGLDDQGSRF